MLLHQYVNSRVRTFVCYKLWLASLSSRQNLRGFEFDCSGVDHTTPEKFKNWKRISVFHAHYNGRIKKTQQLPVILDLWLRTTRSEKSTKTSSKNSVFKMASVHTEIRSQPFSNSSGFEKRFRKAPFWWWISVDGRTNRRNKAVFLNFCSLVWTRPQDKTRPFGPYFIKITEILPALSLVDTCV